jgi:SAM-dependent methyltransferase
VTALEPGARLAAWAAELVPEATVITSTLEDADLSSAAYDCAVAATAMHWVDPMVGVPTFHRALRPSGHIVIWRHVFGRDEVDRSNFRRHVDRIVANRSRRQAHGPQRRSTPNDFTATGQSDLVDEVRWEWSIELTSDQIARLFATFSDWSSDEVEAARQAADNCGGTVTEHYATDLQVLARRP